KEHRVPAGSLGSHHELDQRPRVRIGAPGCEVEAVSHQRSTLWPWSDGPPPPAPPGTPPARRGRDAPPPGSAGHSPGSAGERRPLPRLRRVLPRLGGGETPLPPAPPGTPPTARSTGRGRVCSGARRRPVGG